jgi:spore coat polysaccharide biosynthesis predicted glycosyltransferase SpsG
VVERNSSSQNIGFICDASGSRGAGHAARCLALAEQLISNGVQTTIMGDIGDINWLVELAAKIGVNVRDRPQGISQIIQEVKTLSLSAVVVDSYDFDPQMVFELRSIGLVVLAIIDGDTRGIPADLYLDQNPAALQPSGSRTTGSELLLGPTYSLIRRSFRSHRPKKSPITRKTSIPKVLAFFGGIDESFLAKSIYSLLNLIDLPISATIVDPATRKTVTTHHRTASGFQHVYFSHPPSDGIALLSANSDIVICTSGTSVLEQSCLGSVMALIIASPDQEPNYQWALSAGSATGLGTVAEIKRESKTAGAKLFKLLSNIESQTHQRQSAWKEVDGLGSNRVANLLLERIETK